MKNIIGKKALSGVIVTLLLLIGVIAVVAVIFAVVQSPAGGGTDQLKETQNCAVEPYLDINVRNASIKSQTSGTATFQYAESGGLLIGTLTSGASGTALTLGMTYDVLVSEGSHLDLIVKGIEVKNCGANKLIVDMWRSDGGNVTVYASGGTQLTDDWLGGATNQSSITAGTSRNMKVEVSSLGDQALGVMWFTVELTNKTQVQDLRLSAVSSGITIEEIGKTLPVFGAVNNSTGTSYVETFKVTGLTNEGLVNTMTLTAEAHPSFAIDYTSVYVRSYSQQAFADIDGSFTIGIEDSDGNAKYEDESTMYNFHIT